MAEKRGFNVRLERYLLGELSAAEMSAIKAELEQNPKLRDELAKLTQENQSYYGKYPNLGHGPKEKRGQFGFLLRRPYFRALAAGFTFAAAVVCITVFWPRQTPQKNLIALNPPHEETGSPEIITDGGIRTKGLKPDLFLAVGQRALDDGARVHANDEIQIQYRASGYPYGVILSVDSSKSVTLHFPDSADGSQRLKPGARTSLPHAFKLDEKPGFEKFFLIAAKQKLPLRRIMAELERTGEIKQGKRREFHTVTVRLLKEG